MKGDRNLIVFHNLNCVGCRFADKPKIGTGEPCCTYWQQIEVVKGHCETRRPAESREHVDNK